MESQLNSRPVDANTEKAAEAQKEALDSEAEAAVEKQEEKEDEQNPEQDKFIRLLYNKMLDNEMDEKYVNSILEDASKTKKADLPFDYLLANIYQKMVLKFGKSEGITPAEDGPRIVWFIGPTGVGKTTTIAKLAGKYCVEDKKKGGSPYGRYLSYCGSGAAADLCQYSGDTFPRDLYTGGVADRH